MWLVDLKEGLAKATLALFVLSILTSAAATTQVANAGGSALWLSITMGQAGESVDVYGTGFKSIYPVSITFHTTVVQVIYPDMYGNITATFIIPYESPGVYMVHATNGKGDYAKATITVTLGTFPTPPPTITPTSPEVTKSPVAGSAGFWSPPVIAVIVVAALAVIVPVTFLYRRRGKQETLLDKKPLPYRSELTTPTVKPTVIARYNQPSIYGQQLTKPVVTNRSSQPSSYGQQPPFTKICPRCRGIVKDDYNLCPYCDKKLR